MGTDHDERATYGNGYLRHLSGVSQETFDPVASVTNTSESIVQQVFDTLFTHRNAELGVEPLLADDWTVSADERTYEIRLRAAQFHDGRPVTAADVVYSFERLAASPHSQRADAILDTLGVVHETDDGAYVPGSLGVEAVDDRTVVIELADPYHAARDVLAHSAFSILPAGAVDDVPGHDGDRSQAAFAADPVGCGPFRFESREPERSVRVGAFEAYHGERPSIPGIEFVLREDPDDERYTFELADEIDVFGVAPTKYDPSRATVEREDANGRRLGTYGPLDPLGETVNFTLVPTLNTFYLGFNTDRVPRAVRRAVAYATDRSPVEEALAGRARPAYHLTPPALFPGGVEGYDDHAADYPYGRERRPDAARETLAEAGYGPDDPWELTLTTYRYRAWETLGAAFADQLADVGIDLTVEVLDLEAAVAKNRRGESEAYAIGWLADWPTLDSVLRPADPARSRADADQRSSYFEWGETPAAERARTAYARLADTRGRGEEPQETRNRAALDVETALWEDVPLLPVYHHSYQTFFREYVDLPPMGSLSPGRQKLHTVRYTGPRP